MNQEVTLIVEEAKNTKFTEEDKFYTTFKKLESYLNMQLEVRDKAKT